MKLKEINKGLKCPNCKQWRLRWYHYSPSSYHLVAVEGKHHQPIQNFYRCINCYAEYKEVKR